MKIDIAYNSYTYKFDFKTDDKSFNNEKCGKQCKQIIRENEKNRIEKWFESFLLKLGEDFGRPDLEITFTSIQYECNNVEEIVSKIGVDKNRNWKITLNVVVVEDKNVLGELHELINTMVKSKEDTLYKQLGEMQVLSKIEEIDKSEVSVVFIAPMSAGKSTLINALIGKDLLPSQNQATTATICKIKDIDGKEGFDAVIKNALGEILEEKENIDLSFIEDYNDKGNAEDIEIFIEGDIKNIESSDLKLVLVDTPGPNNSENIRHKEVTLNYIKDKTNNPLILYILNATQLRTDDDKSVLTEIGYFIKQNGSKAKERIIFVLNRIDALDPEKNPKTETLDIILEKCKSYLTNEFEIDSPKIFPMSAQFAKLSLMEGSSLGRKEKDELGRFKHNILPNEKEKHLGVDLIEASPISQKQKDRLYEEANKDEHKACLHYSGLTALQLYINNYVNNTHKIEFANELIKALKPVLNNVIIEHKKAYFSSEEEITKCNEDLEKISPFLSENCQEVKKKLSDKINNINTDNLELNGLKQKVFKCFDDILLKLNKTKAEVPVAKKLIAEANSICLNLAASLSSTINNENESVFKTVKSEIQNMIEESFKQLVTDAKLSDQNASMLKNHIQINVNSSIDKYKSKEILTKTVSVSRWYNPFSWGKTEIVTEQGDIEYVNLKELYDFNFRPNQVMVIKRIDEAISFYKKGVEDLKKEGVSKINEIEENLKEKIDQEKCIKTQIDLSESVKIKKEKELKKMEFYQNALEIIIN